MLGSLIGTALGVGSSLIAGHKASKEAQKNTQILSARSAQNTDWYNKEYNMDGTERADARRVLELTRKSIMERNKQAAGAAAVAGGTEESVAVTKAANAEAMSNTAANIAANAANRKDNINAQYNARQSAIDQAQMGVNNQTANNIMQQGGIAANALMQAGEAVDEWRGLKSENKTKPVPAPAVSNPNIDPIYGK